MVDEPKTYRAVMVSSAFTDMEAHRREIIRVIERVDLMPLAMMNDGALPDSDVIDSSLRTVRDSAAYVGVIGSKYGQIAQDPSRNPYALSVSELEFDEATRLGRPILMFIMADDHPITAADIERDPTKVVKLDAFRSRARQALVCTVFHSLEDFAIKSKVAIRQLAAHLRGNPTSPLPGIATDAEPEAPKLHAVPEPHTIPSKNRPGATKKQRKAPAAKSVPPRRDPEVALLDPDDPWASAVRDHSGSQREAEAFAAMISARQSPATLAVGIFGDWGSGKSFFMRMVYDAIAARVDAPDETGDAGGISFTRQIVQIRFNAWHYAETNLWASLVDHIFTCLDRWAEQHRVANAANAVFDRLATARRLTAEAAEELVDRRRDRTEAATRLEEAQRAVAEKRAVLEQQPGIYLTAAWTAFTGRVQLDKLKAAADRLGLPAATENAAAFTAAAAALDGELSRWALLRSGMIRTLVGPAVVLAVAVGMLLLPPLLTWLASLITPGMPPLATVLSGILVPIGAAFAVATRMTNTALDKLRTARAGFEAELVQQTEAERATEEEARALLAERETAAGEAEERLRQATELAAEAARDYNLQSGKGRVLRFVRDRLASGDYARHLSFVATVRKDFQELSELMTAGDTAADTEVARTLYRAHVEAILGRAGDLLDADEQAKLRSTVVDPAAPPPQVFERIVLYIDDLDRCPSNQVIKVLQAIHLLLTFPLFVVFVAVDVRWLRGALARQYAGQIAEGSASAASAGDYLEKIFQIPYWVRPMGAEGTRAILDDRMGPPEASPSPPPPLSPPSPPDSDEAGDGDDGNDTPLPPVLPPPPTSEPVRTVSLRLTGAERTFINAVADILDGSPRRTLRFINTYRIVKASLPAAEVYHLEHRGYPALLTLLALNVAADDIYPEIVGAIDDAKDAPLQKLKFRFARSQIGTDTGDPRVRRSLALFEQSGSDEQDLARYVKLVARYSFNPDTRLVGAAAGTEEQPPTIPDQT